MKTTYDRLSSWYDWLAGSEEVFNRRGLTMLGLRRGECALEIGFGTGKCVAEMVTQSVKAVGVDLSLGMARVAQARLKKSGRGSQALLCLGDGVRLPYPAKCFDAVFMAFTLELFDPSKIPVVLGDVRRVLRENGRLGIVSLFLPERPGLMVQIYEWFHQVLPTYVDCRPIPAAAMIGQNGFKVEQMECRNMWGLPVEIVLARPGTMG